MREMQMALAASTGCEMSSTSYTAGPRSQLPGLEVHEAHIVVVKPLRRCQHNHRTGLHRLANVRRNLAATRTTPGRAYTRSGLTAVEALIASSAGSMGMRF